LYETIILSRADRSIGAVRQSIGTQNSIICLNRKISQGIMSQHFMARNAMVIAAHPPYSPDLAPSDFYLFGHVKRLLGGESFEAGERLLSAVEGFVKSSQSGL
jgi:hypothetical protein